MQDNLAVFLLIFPLDTVKRFLKLPPKEIAMKDNQYKTTILKKEAIFP
jgi:hypothetical protein